MTISRLIRKNSGLTYGALLTCLVSACSSSEKDPADNTGGSAGSGNAAGSANSAGAVAMGPDVVIGTFAVSVNFDANDATTGRTDVVGKVSDRPLAPRTVWEVTKEDGDCRLEEPRTPFCDPTCEGTDICAEDDTCTPFPVGHSVGEVKLSGVNLEAGGSELVLKEVKAAYQAPPMTTFAFPPFAQGDEVKVHAAGADYPGFELSALGVAPLAFTSSDFHLDVDKAFEVTWPAAADPKGSSIHLKLDLSHHGGGKGLIECDVDDTGSLTISAELMSQVIGLGVAGFPSVLLTRASSSSLKLVPGRVQLVVSSETLEYVTVGETSSCTATSCDADEPECVPCPAGHTCQTDLTCL